MESLGELFIGTIIKHCGVFVRWSYQAIMGTITGADIKTYKQLYNRKDRDPSNRMSDGLIDFLLGIGVIVLIVLALI